MTNYNEIIREAEIVLKAKNFKEEEINRNNKIIIKM